MAAIEIAVLRKTTITLPTLASSATLILPPLAEFIETTGWVSGALVVRVWSETLPNATAKVKVLVNSMMIGNDDPATTFVGATISEVEINDGLSPPTLLQAKIPDDAALVIGRYVGVYLYLDGGANGLSGTVTLAVDVIGRDA